MDVIALVAIVIVVVKYKMISFELHLQNARNSNLCRHQMFINLQNRIGNKYNRRTCIAKNILYTGWTHYIYTKYGENFENQFYLNQTIIQK